MIRRKRSGATADRFVEATLELIEEMGGSQNVNLREVARRVGIAHTTVYYYFDDFPGLLWEALRRALLFYGRAHTEGLADDMDPAEYYHRLITNLIAFPQEHPGLHRFINSDPLDDGDIPGDVVDLAGLLQQWRIDALHACAPGSSRQQAENACNIIFGYLEGESLNLINGRVLPGEDLPGRMLDSSLQLFPLLTGFDDSSPVEPPTYPHLDLAEDTHERN